MRDWLGEKGYDPVFGARRCAASSRNGWRTTLSEAILHHDFEEANTVRVVLQKEINENGDEEEMLRYERVVPVSVSVEEALAIVGDETLYAVLGVSPKASIETIRRAYNKLRDQLLPKVDEDDESSRPLQAGPSLLRRPPRPRRTRKVRRVARTRRKAGRRSRRIRRGRRRTRRRVVTRLAYASLGRWTRTQSLPSGSMKRAWVPHIWAVGGSVNSTPLADHCS